MSAKCIPHLEQCWDNERILENSKHGYGHHFTKGRRSPVSTPPIMFLSLKTAYHLRSKLSSNHSDQSLEGSWCYNPKALGWFHHPKQVLEKCLGRQSKKEDILESLSFLKFKLITTWTNDCYILNLGHRANCIISKPLCLSFTHSLPWPENKAK